MERRIRLRATRRRRRRMHVRKTVVGTAERPRLSVHRSHKQIYVQAVDDVRGVTLAASSSLAHELKERLAGGKREVAKVVGADIAQRLTGLGIRSAVLDRGWYKFHGRVRALTEGAREGGLQL